MGLLNLLVLKKVNEDNKHKQNTKEQAHSPPIPSFIIPGVAAQSLLIAMMVHKFDIPTRHMLFCVLYPTYLIFANHYRFGNNIAVRQRPAHHPFNLSVVMSKIYSESDTTWFKGYMTFATTIGVLLPLLTVSYAPTEVADAAISPLFVLMTQLTCETAVMLNPYVHRFIAFLVPLGFFVYRQSLLLGWFQESMFMAAVHASSIWYTFGAVLSSINLVFWTITLFVFALLRWAPELLADEKFESPQVEWDMMVPVQMKTNGLKKKSSNVGEDQVNSQ